ncbi:hypothetical protein H5410_020626 [Solanum commersonii]|nr:hypothetical protein H5410_020626 [Solanum commersonii]
MIYRYRTGTERNRNEPVPNHDTVPFRVPVQCIPSRPEYYRTGTIPERYRYNPFRCPALGGGVGGEENIYLLCKKLCDDGLADPDGSDLFIPLWHQKASQRAEGVILWDYHVICVQKKRNENSSSLVWDLDSSLPFPSPLGTYVTDSIRPSIQIFSEFKRFFRVVHAPIFLRHFASDRRHMKDSAGNWIAEPPSHEAIVAEDGAVHNLNEYITVSPDDVVKNVEADTVNVVFSEKLGVVIGEDDLLGFFSLIS